MNAINANNAINESFRTVWANLRFARLEDHPKVILVASSMSQEGKSTVLANLGMVMAQAGNRVLLLDTDLRAPTLQQIFSLDKTRGIARALVDIFDADLAQGSLGDFSPGELLRLLKLQDKTGHLTLKNSGDSVRIDLEGGRIVDTSWGERPFTRRLGSLLVKNGKISEEQLSEALSRQAATALPLGHIMINLGYIEPVDLKGPLKLQMSEAIAHTLRWQEGSFSFQDREFVSYEKEVLSLYTDQDPFLGGLDLMLDTPFIDAELAKFIQPTGTENLWAIPSGPLPPNPAALLESARMKELISLLRRRFDLILLDSPPILAVADSVILATLADGVIFVVQSGTYPRDLVKKAQGQIEGTNGRILGVILNAMDTRDGGYYYKAMARYSKQHSKNK